MVNELSGAEYERAFMSVHMANYLPYLQETVERLQGVVVNRMNILKDEGKLTSELALAGWYEYLAYGRIFKTTKVRTIVAASQVDSQ